MYHFAKNSERSLYAVAESYEKSLGATLHMRYTKSLAVMQWVLGSILTMATTNTNAPNHKHNQPQHITPTILTDRNQLPCHEECYRSTTFRMLSKHHR